MYTKFSLKLATMQVICYQDTGLSIKPVSTKSLIYTECIFSFTM